MSILFFWIVLFLVSMFVLTMGLHEYLFRKALKDQSEKWKKEVKRKVFKDPQISIRV